jgi:hypothetical protein
MRRLSSVLLLLGAFAAILGVAGATYGAWVNLPPEAVRAIAMSLPFVVGALLLVVGAVVGRLATREAARAGHVPSRPEAPAQLGPSTLPHASVAQPSARERAT